MAEAQFIPGQGAGNIIGALNSGIGTSASLMERAQARQVREQQMRINEEENDRRRQEFEVLAPAVRAKALADLKKVEVDVKGYEQAELARTSAMTMLPTARAIFDDLMNLEDPDMRSTAALQWVGQYGHLGNIAEFENEFNSKKDIAAKLYTEASALRTMKLKSEQELEEARIRGENAKSSTVPEAVKLLEAADTLRAAGNIEGAKALEAIVGKKGHIAEPRRLELERLRELRNAAEEAGDTLGAEEYNARIAKLNTVTVDPMKQAVANYMNRSGSPAQETAPARAPATSQAATPAAAPAKPQAPRNPAQMSDSDLESFMFGPKK